MIYTEMSNSRIHNTGRNTGLIPALLKPDNTPTDANIGDTFLVPTAVKAKARREVTMVLAGQQALEELENREKGSGRAGHEEEEEEVVARAPVPALAPDRRGEVQTRLLQRKLKHLQEEAEAADEQVVKRQRLTSKKASGVLGWRKGVEDASSKMDLASRVARMEGEMRDDIGQETSEMGQWIRKRLLLNLQEKERLLEQYVVLKKAHDRE